MALGLTNELDAVNTMLSIIGEAPVNTVEDTGVVDAVIARQILNETLRQVQTHPWHWNTDHGVNLTPTFPLPGDICLPANCLQVDATDSRVDVVQRGLRLWDKTNQTFKFTAPVTVSITRLLPFNDLPQAARHYIMVRSGRIFQDRVVGSSTLSGFNEKDELRAYAQLRNLEAQNAELNVLDSVFSQGIVGTRWRGPNL
jgi:hypothetical protein